MPQEERVLESYRWNTSEGLQDLTGQEVAVEEPTVEEAAVEEAPAVEATEQVTTEQVTTEEVVTDQVAEETVEEETSTEKTTEETTEEASENAPEVKVLDDYYKFEATKMRETNELPEDFNVEEATPEAIREAWRVHNLGPIYQQVQTLAATQALTELKRQYTPEALEIARRINNGVPEDTLYNLDVYKELASRDVAELEEPEKVDYISEYLRDKDIDDEIIETTVTAAQEAGTLDNMLATAKEHFKSEKDALETTTKQAADARQLEINRVQAENQNFISSVLSTGKIANEQMSPEQLGQFQAAFMNRDTPIATNDGNTQNISQFEYFQNFVLPDFKNQVYLFKLLVHNGQVDQKAIEAAKTQAKKEAEITWGTVKKIPIPKEGSKVTKKVKNTAQQGASWRMTSEGLTQE